MIEIKQFRASREHLFLTELQIRVKYSKTFAHVVIHSTCYQTIFLNLMPHKTFFGIRVQDTVNQGYHPRQFHNQNHFQRFHGHSQEYFYYDGLKK